MIMAWFVPSIKSLGLAIVSLTFIVGCGSGGDNFRGARGQVSGTVTFQGQPIPEGSTVLFQSKEGSSYTAAGVVKAEGKYSLVYQGGADVPGVTYLVQISPPTSSMSQTATDPADAAMTDGKKLLEATKAIKPPFPKKYSSVATSNLSSTVKAGANTADFALTE